VTAAPSTTALTAPPGAPKTPRMLPGRAHLVSLLLLGLALVHGAARERPADAAPSLLRLSILGSSTSIGVAWNTLSGPPEAFVEVGLASASGRTISVQGKTAAIGGPLGSVSEVVLSGLEPAAEYRYRVGGPRGGFSPWRSFRTGPSDDPRSGRFRFAVVGDSRAEPWDGERGASTNWPMILLAIAARHPAFLLHSGDIVCDPKDKADWAGFLAATAFASGTLPILYTLGNHDNGPYAGEAATYNRLFVLPRAAASLGGSGTEDFYFFTYGNAIFVALSTETFRDERFARQAAWLDRVLAANPRRWRVVFLHRPIYSARLIYSHRPNEVGQNPALVPVLRRHHVDLVFQGHNHFYERWAPSDCRDPASEAVCPTTASRGTVFITSAGGGAFPIFSPGATSHARRAASGKHHFVIVDIEDARLVLRALEPDGHLLDTLVLDKRGESALRGPP
jgi:hypothetical protein